MWKMEVSHSVHYNIRPKCFLKFIIFRSIDHLEILAKFELFLMMKNGREYYTHRRKSNRTQKNGCFSKNFNKTTTITICIFNSTASCKRTYNETTI